MRSAVVLIVAACLGSTAWATSAQRAVVGELEDEMSKASTQLLAHMGENDEHVQTAEGIARDVAWEYLQVKQKANSIAVEVTKLKLDKKEWEAQLKAAQHRLDVVEKGITETDKHLDTETKHVSQLEEDLAMLRDRRKRNKDAQHELEETMKSLTQKIEKSKEHLHELKDVKLENWIRGQLDTFGDFLGSDDTSDAITGAVDGMGKLVADSTSNIARLSGEIEGRTHSRFLSTFITSTIFVIPFAMGVFFIGRLGNLINLRGVILIQYCLLLSYFFLCLLLALGSISILYLHKSSRSLLLLVQLVLTSLAPFLVVSVFFAMFFGRTKREKLYYGIQYGGLLVLFSAITQFWSSSGVPISWSASKDVPVHIPIQLYGPTSRAAFWYFNVCLVLGINIMLTLRSREVNQREAIASDMAGVVRAGSSVLGISGEAVAENGGQDTTKKA